MKKFVFSVSLAMAMLGLSGCSQSPVETVKNGTLLFNQTVTVGNAFEGYSDCVPGTPRWDFGEGTRGEEIVEFRCKIKGATDFREYLNGLHEQAIKSWGSLDRAKQLSAVVQWGAAMEGVDGKSVALSADEYDGLEILSQHLSEAELIVQFAMNKTDKTSFEINGSNIKVIWDDSKTSVLPVTNDFFEQAIYGNKPALNYLDEQRLYGFYLMEEVKKSYNARS